MIGKTKYFGLVALLAILLISGCTDEQQGLNSYLKEGIDMNQSQLESIVKEFANESSGKNGSVQFIYKGVNMLLLSNVKFDRMRIVSSITKYDSLDAEQLEKVMEANFHTALDARYALKDGVLYSAYIHSLSSLSEAQIKSAVDQVSNLALTFGTEYSSGSLNFLNPNKNKEYKESVNKRSI